MMNSLIRIVSATASSLLLAAGFSRLAEKLDPMSDALNKRFEGLMNEADACSVPTMIPTMNEADACSVPTMIAGFSAR